MFGFQVEGPACKTLCLHQLMDPEASADLSSSLIGKLELFLTPEVMEELYLKYL